MQQQIEWLFTSGRIEPVFSHLHTKYHQFHQTITFIPQMRYRIGMTLCCCRPPLYIHRPLLVEYISAPSDRIAKILHGRTLVVNREVICNLRTHA